MFVRDSFMRFFRSHKYTSSDSKDHDTGDYESAYDDPDENGDSLFSKYVNWIRNHVKLLMFALLVVTSLTLAVILSILTYTYVSRSSKFDSRFVAHKDDQMNLFSHHEHRLRLPDYDEREDYNNGISGPTNFEQSPFSLRERHKLSGLNFEQSDNDESAVSHNEIFHDLDDVFENTSPDEYRVIEHGIIDKPLSRKHLKSAAIKEENGETRENSLHEIRPTPMTETKKTFLDPPDNPRPTKRGSVVNEKLASESAEPKHVPVVDAGDTPAMTLYRVQNAVKAGAVCLDGSAPAYYHRPGSGNSEKLWIIHFNGGAWCFDAKACFERSRSSLGSTKKLPPSPPIIQGINSPDPSVNPDFYDWNLVWVVYCDGASFTGNRERPLISDSGETIYLRGKRVLNAIVNDLLYNRDFKLAKAIILTGSSAGSMTAMFQADFIASKFPKTIPVRVLSDAGFFIDTAPIGGKNLGSIFKRVYELQNSSAGLNQDCVRDIGMEDGWECFLPAKTMKYVKTPTFILNSAYDIWALIYFLDIDCKFPTVNVKERRKRNIDPKLFLRSDSELDMSPLNTDADRFLFRRDVRLFKRDLTTRTERDISGFEMLPLFRQSSDRRDKVPTDKPSSQNTSSNNSTEEYNTSVTTDNNNTLQNTTTQVSNHTKYSQYKLNKKKKHTGKSRFFNFIKELGEVTSSDENMNNLFHGDLEAELKNTTAINNNTTSNSTAESSQTKQNTSLVADQPISAKKESPSLAENILDSMNNTTEVENLLDIGNKEIASLDSKVKLSKQITTKSMIPTAVKFLHNESTNPFEDMNNILQGIDRLRRIKEQSRHIFETKLTGSQLNISMAVKRHHLNETGHSKIKKSKRSTSIAKEYINILRSDPPECTEKEILNAMKYRPALLHSTDTVMRMPKSGRFLVSCIDHSLSLFDETWTGLIVGGKSIQQAFGDWFYERGSKEKYNLVDCPYPCNPSCP